MDGLPTATPPFLLFETYFDSGPHSSPDNCPFFPYCCFWGAGDLPCQSYLLGVPGSFLMK